MLIRYTLTIWVIKVPTENDMYGIFNPFIVIDNHGYDGKHINGNNEPYRVDG